MSAASAPSQAPGSQTILRGRLLCPDATRPALQEVPDGLVHIQAGRITAVEPAPPGCALPETLPGAIWLPGFVDTHVHFPQTRIIGSATGPLLDWLASSVFPEEARFKERAYAEDEHATLVAPGHRLCLFQRVAVHLHRLVSRSWRWARAAATSA